LLTPAGLEVQIFVDPKEANNVPAELKEKIRKVQDKGNMLRGISISISFSSNSFPSYEGETSNNSNFSSHLLAANSYI